MGWAIDPSSGEYGWQDDAPTGALPTAAPQNNPALTPEPAPISTPSPAATNRSGMVNSAHQAAVTDAPNGATAEQKAFIDWQRSQANQTGPGTQQDVFASQGIQDWYTNPAILAQAQEQIDRANRRIASGADPTQVAEWNDPNWQKYQGTNKEAYNTAQRVMSDPAYAAKFAADNGLYGAQLQSWVLRASDPTEWDKQQLAAASTSNLVVGPGGKPTGTYYAPGQSITAGEKYSQQFSGDQLGGIRDLWWQYKDDPLSMSKALNQFGFTPDDLGLALGMSKNQVEKYFTGQTVPTVGNQTATKGLEGINTQQLNAKTAYDMLDQRGRQEFFHDWAAKNGVTSMTSPSMTSRENNFTPWGTERPITIDQSFALDASWQKATDDYNASHPYTPFALKEGKPDVGRPNDQSIAREGSAGALPAAAATTTAPTTGALSAATTTAPTTGSSTYTPKSYTEVADVSQFKPDDWNKAWSTGNAASLMAMSKNLSDEDLMKSTGMSKEDVTYVRQSINDAQFADKRAEWYPPIEVNGALQPGYFSKKTVADYQQVGGPNDQTLHMGDQLRRQQQAGTDSIWVDGKLSHDTATLWLADELKKQGVEDIYDLGMRSVESKDEDGNVVGRYQEAYNKKTGKTFGTLDANNSLKFHQSASGGIANNVVFDKDGIPVYYNTKQDSDWVQFRGNIVPVAALALNAFFPGAGAAVGGALGLTGTAASVVGGALVGAGTAALTGGDVGRGALFGGLGGASNMQIGDTGFKVGTVVNGLRAADALSKGNVLGALSAVGAMPGMSKIEIGDTGITIGQALTGTKVAAALMSNHPEQLFGTLASIARSATNNSSTKTAEADTETDPATQQILTAFSNPQNLSGNPSAQVASTDNNGALAALQEAKDAEAGRAGGKGSGTFFDSLGRLRVVDEGESEDDARAAAESAIAAEMSGTTTGTETGPLSNVRGFTGSQSEELPPEMVITDKKDEELPPEMVITAPKLPPAATPPAATPPAATPPAATPPAATSPKTASVPYVSSAGSSTTTGALPGSLQGTSLAAGPIGAQVKLMQDLKQLYPQLSNIDPHLLSILSGKVGSQPKQDMLKQDQQNTAIQTSSPLSKLMSPTGSRPDALMQAGLSLLSGSGSLAGYAKGGKVKDSLPLSQHVPEFITGKTGNYVQGAGDGQSDDIPAMLADGEYVFDADIVSALGNGSNKAGAQVLDKMRQEIRKHKRSAHVGKIPPPAKSPLEYMKG